MTLVMHGTLSTSSSSFSSMSVLQRLRTSRNPCADSQEPRGDGYTDPEPRTGYEPKKRIVDNQIIYEQEDKTCTEDNQITEIEGHVKSFSYNQSLLSSAQDSIESIATPQEAGLGRRTNSCSAGLHHGTCRSKKQERNDRKFVTLKEKA